MAELVTPVMISAFLAFDGARPWTPGATVDCCLALAEWAIWLGYPDPAAHLRGIYTPGRGQIDILAARGGALELVGACARAIGADRVREPSAGCIGVVGSRSNPARQFGVIHDGRGWLTRTPSGWHGISARALDIWKI